MRIELREIHDGNRAHCIALRTTPEQKAYIASNEDSLGEAQKEEYAEIARPFAIYADEVLVGFAMFAFDENNEDADDRYWLWRFMIDASLQGKGYGSAALKEIIEYFRRNGADQITLSTKESNEKALGLYHKFGFRENGEMNDEEIVLKLHLTE
ncbi:N-acetyltransferase [uncultured Acetatifactor sp.]|jgi:diamine N-acetyltransferase|uniref:GNAT family N-acetyltransferase n=1 Tax=uncultured Acetatifactor sp. TaxID=1671927 RepID=UPI00261D7391|nr:GNAT family N-acetyltransferase [uncultured Acetatifactor sp.]